MDVNEVVRRMAEGDVEALGILYEATHQKLFRTAYLVCGRREDAEDAVMETYVKAYAKVQTLQKPDRLEAWLMKILMRECYTILRKGRRENADEYAEEKADAAGLYERRGRRSSFEAVEDKVLVGEWLSQLDPKKRQVVVLYYYGEMTTREIAETLGTTEGTVKSRLHHARRMLGTFDPAWDAKGAGHYGYGF